MDDWTSRGNYNGRKLFVKDKKIIRNHIFVQRLTKRVDSTRRKIKTRRKIAGSIETKDSFPVENSYNHVHS